MSRRTPERDGASATAEDELTVVTDASGAKESRPSVRSRAVATPPSTTPPSTTRPTAARGSRTSAAAGRAGPSEAEAPAPATSPTEEPAAPEAVVELPDDAPDAAAA